jgi:hypothetical protein
LQWFALAFDSCRAASPSIFGLDSSAQSHQNEADTLISGNLIAGTLRHTFVIRAKNDA